MKITGVSKDKATIEEIAEILMEGFLEKGVYAWETMKAAIEEVRESLAEDRISRIAVGEDGQILGWIGGIEEYDGYVWELHPLVVRPGFQRRGIGQALVADFENEVRLRGGTTIRLGTDDENNRTSLGGVDLYPNVLEHLLNIENLRGHPYEFYQKLGYAITGVIPDANGFGKPDILMAKRV